MAGIYDYIINWSSRFIKESPGTSTLPYFCR
jgi:hypothetical protein